MMSLMATGTPMQRTDAASMSGGLIGGLGLLARVSGIDMHEGPHRTVPFSDTVEAGFDERR